MSLNLILPKGVEHQIASGGDNEKAFPMVTATAEEGSEELSDEVFGSGALSQHGGGSEVAKGVARCLSLCKTHGGERSALLNSTSCKSVFSCILPCRGGRRGRGIR